MVLTAGYGKIGKLRTKILLSRKDVKVIGIYDVLNIDDKIDGVEYCDSFDQLLRLDITAIFICKFYNVLVDYTIKSLKKGLHIFCEKPPAVNTNELVKVIDVYKQNNKSVLKYGFNHRYHYSVMEAKKIIESGKMGKILWMRGVYGKAGSIDYDKNWRNHKKLSGGGILLDQGIHLIDLILYLSKQDFKKINSFVTTSSGNIESEDNAFVIMQSDENVTAMLHSTANQWRHKFLLEMCFENGYINLDGILSGTRSYAPEKMIVGMREFEDITFAMGKPKETVTWFENDDSWSIEIAEFLDSIKGIDQIKNGTIEDAYNAINLVDKIYENSGF